MGFFSDLQTHCQKIGSLLCVGLDPHPSDLPVATAQAASDFCRRLIDATAPYAAAYKPNAAFFEAFGAEGWQALHQVVSAVPQDIPVILDAKRGDIASTAEAYATSAFMNLGVHAITINPYLGHDSIKPFLTDAQRAVFLLCKTSNPGSSDFQDLPVGLGTNETLYETIARKAQSWNSHDNLGLVAGATHPEALKRVRQAAPDLWILAPGVGAQGGELEKALQAGLRSDGYGLLLPISRAISRAGNPAEAARKIRDEIQVLRPGIQRDQKLKKAALPTHLQKLADGLLQAGCVKFGLFTLKSGLQSPVYLDLRQLVSYPRLLAAAAQAYAELLEEMQFDRLAALPYAALPIGTAISLIGDWPVIYPRKETKQYGTRAEIEGQYSHGEKVVVIDDLATTGGSKFETIEKLLSAGLQVNDVVVLIDRQSGAVDALAEQGYIMKAVFTLTQLLDYWQGTGQMSSVQADSVRRFIKDPQSWQEG